MGRNREPPLGSGPQLRIAEGHGLPTETARIE